MIDQSDPGAQPKARARKTATTPKTDPIPPAQPTGVRIEAPRGNVVLWSMFAAACVVVMILLGMLANRPKAAPDGAQVAGAPDSSAQVVTYGANAGAGTYVNGPLPENTGGATYAPGAGSPGAPGVTGTTAPGSVGDAGAVAMTGTTGGVNAGTPGAAAGARGTTAPSGGAFGAGATAAGARGTAGTGPSAPGAASGPGAAAGGPSG